MKKSYILEDGDILIGSPAKHTVHCSDGRTFNSLDSYNRVNKSKQEEGDHTKSEKKPHLEPRFNIQDNNNPSNKTPSFSSPLPISKPTPYSYYGISDCDYADTRSESSDSLSSDSEEDISDELMFKIEIEEDDTKEKPENFSFDFKGDNIKSYFEKESEVLGDTFFPEVKDIFEN